MAFPDEMIDSFHCDHMEFCKDTKIWVVAHRTVKKLFCAFFCTFESQQLLEGSFTFKAKVYFTDGGEASYQQHCKYKSQIVISISWHLRLAWFRNACCWFLICLFEIYVTTLTELFKSELELQAVVTWSSLPWFNLSSALTMARLLPTAVLAVVLGKF